MLRFILFHCFSHISQGICYTSHTCNFLLMKDPTILKSAYLSRGLTWDVRQWLNQTSCRSWLMSYCHICKKSDLTWVPNSPRVFPNVKDVSSSLWSWLWKIIIHLTTVYKNFNQTKQSALHANNTHSCIDRLGFWIIQFSSTSPSSLNLIE